MKSNINRAAAVAAALCTFGVGDALAQQTVTLRSTIESSGSAVTLGDFFADAGPASGRAVAPGVPAGQTRTFSPRFVHAAAKSAGLDWTPPANMTAILVAGRGGGTATAQFQPTSGPTGDIAIRRGEIVTLTFTTPDMKITTRARATSDGGVGDAVRLVNLHSNRTIDAVVTGAGAATARAN